MLATLVDGGSKYMADAGSYDRMTYEAMNSRFAQGSAELLVDAIAEVVNVDRGLNMVTAPSGAEPTAGPPSRRTPTSKVD